MDVQLNIDDILNNCKFVALISVQYDAIIAEHTLTHFCIYPN